MSLDIQELQKSFDQACYENDSRIGDFHNQHNLIPILPQSLHHYTNIQGVHGILKSGSLWLTNVDYLNDATEIEYGVKLASEVINDVLKKEMKGEDLLPVRDHLFRLDHEIGKHRTRVAYFVTCFCEEPDLLSQWRAYGQSGGFCMNFNADNVQNSIPRLNDAVGGIQDPHSGRSLYFERVIYNVQSQREIIEGVLKLCLDSYQQILARHNIDKLTFIRCFGNTEDASFLETLKMYSLYTTAKLMRFVSLFKHPSFAEEKEWRLIHHRHIDDCYNLEFRLGRSWLIPYVEVKFDLNDSLESITCGPPVIPMAVRSLRTYLKSLGLQDKRIHGTAAPLRT